ncbi:cadherin-like beta sandwich domain-containing protein [[Clostridium] aminophilum]|uniref:cadherin-like beta sandwich domain-containing protein n=1 Tax=[Clostridium] aminophilum TaxID=1526 RepID=UPI0026ED2844|nr:cadherin-like beta sandwich domain-containing protein [[Clostridium] aminophilum]
MKMRLNHVKFAAAALLAAGILSVESPVGRITAWASSAVISFSDPDTKVGDTFNVNVKITSTDGTLGSSKMMLKYDSSVIEFQGGSNASGGAGAVKLSGSVDSTNAKSVTYQLKFKALSEGSTTIKVDDYEVYDANSKNVDVSKVGKSSIRVKKGSGSTSGKTALKTLKVSSGSLSPAFSPDITSYTVNVGEDVTDFTVNAEAEDSSSKVHITGDTILKDGVNTVECEVSSPDGASTRKYILTVNKGAAATASSGEKTASAVLSSEKATVDSTEYTVAQSFDSKLIPAGFEEGSVEYKSASIMCAKTESLCLLYLVDAAGTGNFYIYDQQTDAFSPFVTINVTEKSIVVLTPDDTVAIPKGFSQTTIQLNGNYEVVGWTPDSGESSSDYCLVYGMNSAGEKGLYSYDLSEKTMQRYFEKPGGLYDDAQIEEIIDKYNALQDKYNHRFLIMAALAFGCVILFITIINLLLHRHDRIEEAREEAMRRDYYEEDTGRRGRGRRAAEDGPEIPFAVKRRSDGEDCGNRPDRRPEQEFHRTAKKAVKTDFEESRAENDSRSRNSAAHDSERPSRSRGKTVRNHPRSAAEDDVDVQDL